MPLKPGARQLGVGIYMSPLFYDWPPPDVPDDEHWDCRVTADARFWEGLKKGWVPRYMEAPEDSTLELQRLKVVSNIN